MRRAKRGKLRRRRTQSYGPTEGRRRRRSLEACAKRSREAEAAKERPFFTESNKDLGIAAPRPPPTRAKPASFRERETNPLDSPQNMRSEESGRISAARAGQRQIFAKSWTSLARWTARAGWMVPDFRWIGRSETQRARPARLNDYTAKVWTSLADRRAGRGKRRSRVRKGEAEPKTPRRAEADFFSLCRWLRRGETPNGNEPTTFHSRHRPPEKKNRNHHKDRAQTKEKRASRGERR